MSKKSKFDLESLQKQFDEILIGLSKEDILVWLEKDKEIQCSVMLTGAKISIASNSVSYEVTNAGLVNNILAYEYQDAA